jgi:hypothetical protein
VLAHPATEQGFVDRRLRVEVLVERRLAQPNPPSDLGQVERCHALLAHHFERGVEDLLARLQMPAAPAIERRCSLSPSVIHRRPSTPVPQIIHRLCDSLLTT